MNKHFFKTGNLSVSVLDREASVSTRVRSNQHEKEVVFDLNSPATDGYRNSSDWGAQTREDHEENNA